MGICPPNLLQAVHDLRVTIQRFGQADLKFCLPWSSLGKYTFFFFCLLFCWQKFAWALAQRASELMKITCPAGKSTSLEHYWMALFSNPTVCQ